MKRKVLFFTLFLSLFAFSQKEQSSTVVDSLFREDQIYASIGYNLLQNRPKGFKQYSFSPVFTIGILRDFPISKNRHWSLAPGIGYAYNNAKQFINEDDLSGTTTVGAGENVRTRIVYHQLEFPFEFRWRNATPESHKFWRVHLGFKASYAFSGNLRIESSTGEENYNLKDDITKWQFGTYLTVGYNTWNPYVYYGLDPIFKEGSKLSSFNVGVIFYIL